MFHLVILHMFQIKKQFNSLDRRPHVLTPTTLKQADWSTADEYAQRLSADFERRGELLVRRLDCTVDSFLWSDRHADKTQQVTDTYNKHRRAIATWQPVTVADVLGATEGTFFS